MLGKIAFLFLTISEINHEQPWINFFKGHEERYSLYIHSKKEFNTASQFKKFELPFKIPTRWDLTMAAQVELLKVALKNPANQKFVFVSESTIPLQTFNVVYSQLMAHEWSIFEYYKPNPTLARCKAFMPILPKMIYKNWQWVVLNRKHATLMANDQRYLKVMCRPYDQEHYPATFLNIMNLLRQEVVNKNTTLVIWPEKRSSHPVTFTNLRNDPYFPVLVDGIKKGMLFARKFPKDCDLALLTKYIKY